MNAHPLRQAARCGLVVLLLALVGALPAAHAACAQIRNWSDADAASFPVPELSRIAVANDPAPYYVHLGTGQPSTQLVTQLAFSGYPRVMRNRTFSSSVTLSLASFVDEAQAQAVFEQDVATFLRSNSSPGWGYQLETSEGQPGGSNPLAFYRDDVSEKMVHMLRRYQNVLIKITLNSDSRDERVHPDGVAELHTRAAQAMRLIERKCGQSINEAPAIEVTTSTGSFGAARFQRDMVQGVMMLKVRDLNGLDDLDFQSLRVTVAGIDKTSHFLEVIGRLAAQNRIEYAADESAAIYALQLDARQLMGDHNVFNIAWNGYWDVSLRICDRRGACGQKDHRLYFGPYLVVTGFQDRRCIEGSGYLPSIELIVDFGNNGHEAQTLLLVALGPNDDFLSWRSRYWSASLYELGAGSLNLNWYDDSNGLMHVTWPLPVIVASGQSTFGYKVALPPWAVSSSGSRVDLPAARHTLVYGAMDVGVLGTPYLKGSSNQQLCNR